MCDTERRADAGRSTCDHEATETGIVRWLPCGAISAGDGHVCPTASAPFLDADEVARRISDGAVPNPVRLIGRLLHDVGAASL